LPSCKIYLFGSRARKQQKPGSDFDIAVDAGYKLGIYITSAIKEEIEETSIPVFVDVFEFSIELFWKDLKLYLEGVKNVQLESNTPRDVFRVGCRARLISEQDTEKFIDILKIRNLTSYIYKEEIAEQFARDLLGFYRYMKTIAGKLNP
jgi:nucleotidyltransferase substrate binding protein (TIGR01987 family)